MSESPHPVIDDIISNPMPLDAMARRHHMTPTQLAQLLAEPINRQALQQACEAANLVSQILINHTRLTAVSALATIAARQEGETSRRASADLLRTELRRGYDPDDAAFDDELIAGRNVLNSLRNTLPETEPVDEADNTSADDTDADNIPADNPDAHDHIDKGNVDAGNVDAGEHTIDNSISGNSLTQHDTTSPPTTTHHNPTTHPPPPDLPSSHFPHPTITPPEPSP